VDGLVSGYGHALMPIAAVKLFGFTTGEWSNLVAVMGLTGAFAALALGPVIDRVGAKRMFMLTILLVAVHAFLLAGTQHLWNNSFYVRGMLSAWVLMGPVTMVCAIAIAMSICTKGVSATQFAIYMSMANLGASIGSKLFGMASEHASYSQSYLLMGVLFISLFLIIMAFRKQQPEELVSSEEGAGG
ncbi:MAG: MFS transporter, partial [Chromatiales bacterium]|nr:MFS transporter [Chromatiales bacterium]